EGEEDVLLDDFAGAARQRDVGLEDRALWPAELVFAVEAPEHEGNPPDPGLFEDEAHLGMAFADAGKDDRAHQFRHRPYREIGDPHQRLVARLEPLNPDP